jgi:hypothetical protein
MRLLWRRLLPYLVAVPLLVGLWSLVDLVLVVTFRDALPTSRFVRPLLTLASVVVVSLFGMAVLAGCSLLLVRAHRREESRLHSFRDIRAEKMAVEGRLDFEWLCQEPETRQSAELLRSIR